MWMTIPVELTLILIGWALWTGGAHRRDAAPVGLINLNRTRLPAVHCNLVTERRQTRA